MKTKLALLLLFWLLCALTLLAQPGKSFPFNGGSYKLLAVCEWLNKEQQLNISFNHNEKALQTQVNIAKGNYTFERLFSQYFKPHQLAYKIVAKQIIIYVDKSEENSEKKRGDRITLNGYITDSASGERLQGATVAVLNTGLAAVSNNYGFYSLTIPEGLNEIVVNVVGYAPTFTTLALQKDTAIGFKLSPATATLSTVTITASGGPNRKIPIQQSSQMSMIDMPIEAIEAMPKLLGETDVFRSLQFLPGVLSSNEVNSGLYVRGGSPDQNLILLDGVPVYNASHMFGLFSVFNSDALQSVQLYKGGFPARFGGRLSSVIDLRMKEGNKYAWHGEGGIGLIASRFTLEGPLSKGRSSIMMSGRVTNWGPLIKWVSKKAADPRFDNEATYNFYDLNLKTNFYLGKKDHLYISSYLGKDHLQSDESYSYDSWNGSRKSTSKFDVGLKWGNTTAVARWNHQFSKKIFSNTTVHYSRYQYYLFKDDVQLWYPDEEHERNYQKHSSDLQDVAVKFDIDIIPATSHYIRAGISATRHHFMPGTFHSIIEEEDRKKDTTISGDKSISGEYDIYVEDDLRITDKLKANVGLHGTGFTVGKKLYTSLQPRVSARYLLSNAVSIKGAFVYMNQFIHLLSNSGIGLPTDLWVPVTETIPPQKSRQYTLGVAYTSPKDIELSLEAYYKQMNNVLEYEEGATFTNTTINWEQRVDVGDGKSRGIELLAQKKKGKTTGLISYTLSKTDRTFADINEGRTFPYRYDRRHDIKLAFNHKFSDRKELSFDWMFGSGQAITVPIETYADRNGETVTVYTKRNGFRMPVYHRADISMSFHKQKRKYQRTWVIGLYNIYGRQNPMYISLNSHDINRVTGLRQTSVLAFPIPSFTYQIKF
jgi:hypothetical protein